MRKPIRRPSAGDGRIKHIEQVIPVAIAISCHFDVFPIRYGLAVASDLGETPTGAVAFRDASVLRGLWREKECKNLTAVGATALAEATERVPASILEKGCGQHRRDGARADGPAL